MSTAELAYQYEIIRITMDKALEQIKEKDARIALLTQALSDLYTLINEAEQRVPDSKYHLVANAALLLK